MDASTTNATPAPARRMKHPRRWVRRLRSTRAVSALEYAILIGIVVAAVTVGAISFQNKIADVFTKAGDSLDKAGKIANQGATP